MIMHMNTMVLLSSSYKMPGRRLLFSRARLFIDRIELTGWYLGEKHFQTIRLEEVCSVEWQDENSYNAILHLRGDESVALKLSQPARWKQSLETRLRWIQPRRHRVTTTMHPGQSLRDLITYSTSMG